MLRLGEMYRLLVFLIVDSVLVKPTLLGSVIRRDHRVPAVTQRQYLADCAKTVAIVDDDPPPVACHPLDYAARSRRTSARAARNTATEAALARVAGLRLIPVTKLLTAEPGGLAAWRH
jgi:hypothetical protein